MSRQTRRTFIKQAAAGIGATFVIGGTKSTGKVLGANDTIRVGVAGIRGRGGAHIGTFVSMEGVQVTHLIDPDIRYFESRSEQVKKRGGNTPKCVKDIREALEDKELDLVSIATPNHWHSLITIWACQAGKDVYVEKPCSHNVFEGRKVVEAARKYNRIVQHGTQSRSSESWAKATAAARSGKYGKLLVSKAYASKPRWSIGFKPIAEPPAEVDFNLWLGPAPLQPYHGNLVPYNWHWFWDTGNGEIGNQGVHQMDIARWAIKDATLPKSAYSLGGRWVDSTAGKPEFTDQGQTPNMQLTVFEFGQTLLVFEVAGLCGKTVVKGGKAPPNKVDNEFYLEEGVIKGGKFYPKGKDVGEELVEVEYKVYPGGPFGNLINCVRSRKPEELNAEILEGHLSSAICHLGNISYYLGKQVPGTEKPESLNAHSEVQRSWASIQEALKNAIGLDLAKSTYQLGPTLKFDAQAEKFIGNPEANKLLTRPEREPFVVPKEV